MLGMWAGFTWFRIAVNVRLVKYRPSWKANNGPLADLVQDKYLCSAVTGHRGEKFLTKRTVEPTLKGSVLDPLNKMSTPDWLKVRSQWQRVEAGSYVFTWEDVYSEMRRKPKNAVNMAAQIIILSA